MVKDVTFVNHVACLCVMNEPLQFLLAINAITPPAWTCRGQPDQANRIPHKTVRIGYSKAWYHQKWFPRVPGLSTSSALVTLNLTKSQWSKDEKAIEAIKAEAKGLRANGTWDDSIAISIAELLQRARAEGEDIIIAEVHTEESITMTSFHLNFRNIEGE